MGLKLSLGCCGSGRDCCTEFEWTFKTQCSAARFIFSGGKYNGGLITPYLEITGTPNRFMIGMSPEEVLAIVVEDGLAEHLLFGPIGSITDGPHVSGAGEIPDTSFGPTSLSNPARLLTDPPNQTVGSIRRLVTNGGAVVEHTWSVSFTITADPDSNTVGASASVFLPGSLEIRVGASESLNNNTGLFVTSVGCLLYTSPSPRDQRGSRMPSSA